MVLNNDIKKISKLLFKNDFEGWIHGPGYASLYPKYKRFGVRDIAINSEPEFNLPGEARKIADFIFNEFGIYSADQLEDIVHDNEAWLESRKKITI